MKRKLGNVAQGEAGVLHVASLCLRHNLKTFKPLCDTEGVDLLVSDAGYSRFARVQVKTTMLTTVKSRAPHKPFYQFELRACRLVALHRYDRRLRQFSLECDFVVLHGLDEDRFWIVPAAILNGIGAVKVTPAPRWVEGVTTESVKQARSEGLLLREIAEKFGVSTQVIFDRLHRGDEPTAGRIVREVRRCEGRWDLIQSFVSPQKELTMETQQVAKPTEGEPR